MASLRSGDYGNYYGSEWGSSEALSQSQADVNAKYIAKFFYAHGWKKNPIAATIGNMAHESSLNPGRWQSDDVGNTSLGYSLVQWTPSTKYTEWAEGEGYDPSTMDSALSRIIYELENGGQYYATSEYPETFQEYTQSTKSLEYLTYAFLKNYERAGVEAIDSRIERTNYYYSVIGDDSGGDSGETEEPEPEEPSGHWELRFTPRTSKYNPSDMCWYGSITGSNKYWYDNTYNAGATAGLCLPNCTTYAMGRVSEIAGANLRNYDLFNRTGFPDASNWYSQGLWEKGTEAQIGSIICWNSANHVAVVEQVDNGIMLSMSGYVAGSGTRSFTNPGESSSWYFRYMSLEEAIGYYGSPTGYLYNPHLQYEWVEDEPEPTPQTKKKKNYKWVLFSRSKPK